MSQRARRPGAPKVLVLSANAIRRLPPNAERPALDFERSGYPLSR